MACFVFVYTNSITLLSNLIQLIKLQVFLFTFHTLARHQCVTHFFNIASRLKLISLPGSRGVGGWLLGPCLGIGVPPSV